MPRINSWNPNRGIKHIINLKQIINSTRSGYECIASNITVSDYAFDLILEAMHPYPLRGELIICLLYHDDLCEGGNNK